MQQLQKMKPFLGWIPIILTVLIMLSIAIWINFRSYGMYYASKYYGRDNTYRIFVESFKSGYNPHQKMEQKNVFSLLPEDKGGKIIFLGGERSDERYISVTMDKGGKHPEIGVYIDTSGGAVEINELNASIESHMYQYYLKPKQNLAFDHDVYHDRVVGQKKIINLDKRVFKYYADKYVDTQLETLGKPKINLQWIYNLVQMI